MINNKPAKVITFAGVKGGIGKTVLTNALCSYLLHHYSGLKVLLIDLNSQMDLTDGFKNLTTEQKESSSIVKMFKHDSKRPMESFPKGLLQPAKINDNLDILTASQDLIYTDDIMRTQPATAPYVLSHLFSAKSGLGLLDKYDYILIDTHNDRQLPVQNAFVVSDYILSPVIPSKYGINSIADTLGMYNDLKNRLSDPVHQMSYIHAKLYFVGNMVKFNTKPSLEFLKAIKKDPQFIACFRERELFNKATMNDSNIYDYAKYEAKVKHNYNDEKALKKEITPQFQKIMQIIKK